MDSSSLLLGKQGFPAEALPTFRTKEVFVVGAHPVHYRIFSSISGLYPRDASGTLPPSYENQTVPRHCQVSPGSKTGPGQEPPS